MDPGDHSSHEEAEPWNEKEKESDSVAFRLWRSEAPSPLASGIKKAKPFGALLLRLTEVHSRLLSSLTTQH